MADYDYDLLVIGSGPAGQRAGIQAAKLDKRVAIIERKSVIGGVWLNLGTIPSKTLRESVLFVELMHSRTVYGISVRMEKQLNVNRLMTPWLHRAPEPGVNAGAVHKMVDEA